MLHKSYTQVTMTFYIDLENQGEPILQSMIKYKMGNTTLLSHNHIPEFLFELLQQVSSRTLIKSNDQCLM